MRFFYDGQIRRYVVQLIRMLSGFQYQTSDGIIKSVPVMFGDMSKQAATILNQNSENAVQTVPRIAVYITGLELDRTRLRDQTFVSKMQIRERDIDQETGEYLRTPGKNFTVERLMPTPYKLSVKADIWASNTEQKLQILEQILVFFNPSLEIQTTDNYVDWASLSVVNLNDIVYSSKSIPVGTDDQPDIATLNFDTPIWISAPAKVKKLGVITNIITNIFDESEIIDESFIYGEPMTSVYTSIGGFGIMVLGNEVTLLDPTAAVTHLSEVLDVPYDINSTEINWYTLFDFYPSKFRAGVSQLFLNQPNGSRVIGTIQINPTDDTRLTVEWDQDTFPTNTLIKSSVYTIGKGTIDAVVDPERFDPKYSKSVGTRFMILSGISGAKAWDSTNGVKFYAEENDLIEWNGESWEVVLEAKLVDQVIYVTNLKTSIQYKLENGYWTKSFDGEYLEGSWQLVL